MILKISTVNGNDVWIGSVASIMGRIEVLDGAVIGAKSLITKDLKSYSINVSIPARCIGYRFEEKYRDFLQEFRWWDKEICLN